MGLVSFSNPFFSTSGQAERLGNAAKILNPFSGQGVYVLGQGTNLKGFVTTLEVTGAAAFAGAGLIAAGPSGIASAVRATGTSAAKVGQLAVTYPKAALAVGVLGYPVGNLLLKKPELVVKGTKSFVNFENNLSDVIENPSLSGGAKLVQENPLVTSAGVVALAGLSAGTVAGIISTVVTKQNTNAIKESNDLVSKGVPQGPSAIPSPPAKAEKKDKEAKTVNALPVTSTATSGLDVAATPPLSSINPEKAVAVPKTYKRSRKVYKRKAMCGPCGNKGKHWEVFQCK